MSPPNQYSCVTCSRRKIKCDKLSPCSGCFKAQAACVYRAPVPSQRHRKRLTQNDLLSKVHELERLLQSHGIPFNPLDNSWIRSPWEQELIKSPHNETSAGPGEPTVVADAYLTAPDAVDGPSRNMSFEEQHGAARLWADLPEDLKAPVVSHLKRPGKDEEEHPGHSAHSDTAFATPSIFMSEQLYTAPGQLELHPDPKHAFKLWQIFIDNVNPLTKIIHAPTLQQKILETAWSVEMAPKPLEATMFSVYALAAASMRADDCIQLLGASRPAVVSRYRTGALRALSSTDLLSTRDLEVLQALTLVLMIDPQSEFSTTAVALAMRIAHKMGLHRAGENSHIPFFEQEMQVRMWWYIRGLDSRTRRAMGLLSTIDDLGDVRLPMNVNDADLHPCMTNPPAVQHTAPTEMVYCLIKYDLWNFVRKSSNFAGTLNPREKAFELTTSSSVESVAKKKKVLAEVELMLQEKYLAHLDPSIPLHRLSAAMANITIHRQRFLMFHPRHQPEGGRHLSPADQDMVFDSSVRLLELDRDVRSTSFSAALVDNMTCRTQVEALVYMVSELRRRTTGGLVGTAWALLQEMHDEQPTVLQGNHRFYTALADLTLEAWKARRQTLALPAEAVPKFIEILEVLRGKAENVNGAAADAGALPTGFIDGLLHDDPLDWTYWSELFPQ